jgi:hypothetical protein
MGLGEGRQQIVGNLVTEIFVLLLVVILKDEGPTIRKCRLSRRNFLDEERSRHVNQPLEDDDEKGDRTYFVGRAVRLLQSDRKSNARCPSSEKRLTPQNELAELKPIAEIDSRIKRHHIEVSQQVGRGVRSKASRTTRKINPKQNIDHNQRSERSLGVSPFGSQGNIFVA